MQVGNKFISYVARADVWFICLLGQRLTPIIATQKAQFILPGLFTPGLVLTLVAKHSAIMKPPL